MNKCSLVVAGLLASLLLQGCARRDAAPGATAPPPADTETMECGALPITVTAGTDEARMTAAGRQYRLQRVRSASGSRYRAVDTADTELWTRGERARLVLAGEPLPVCLAPGAVPRPFEARGNEPFWRLVLDGAGATLERPAEEPLRGRFRWQSRTAERSRGQATLGSDRATVTVRHSPCRDSMSGMPHPRTVTIDWRGHRLRGCGGDPLRLLRGGPWHVADLPGRERVHGATATVRFLEEGRLAGNASCNRYTGRYELTGAGLGLEPGATTRMACEPAVMEQEARLLARLQRVRRFRIGEAGGIELLGSRDVLVRLRRP